MARYKVTLSQSGWSGGTAAFWFDPDVGENGTAYDADTDGNAITSITLPTRASYTFLGFGLTNPYWRCVDESGNIFAAKCKELFNTASTAVTGSLQAKTLNIYQAQTSTISGSTATLRTITVYATYWKGAISSIYYNPEADRFYLDQAQTTELSASVTAGRECWTYSGCFAGTGPQYVSTVPAKSGDQYIDGSGNILDELRIRAKVQTTPFTIYPRGEYFSFKIVLDANGGSIGDGGVSAIYRPVSATGRYYTDYLCAYGTEITALSSVQLPELSSKVFGGFTGTKVTNASGAASATYYADKDGVLNIANLDALSLSPTGSVPLVYATVYARWVGICTVTINKGTNGTNAVLPIPSFYADTVNGGFYADQDLAEPITGIGVPTNECYAFSGCFNSSAGSTQYIGENGDITAALAIAEYTTSFNVYCQWNQVSWKLSLSKGGGIGGTDAIYRSLSSGNWYADPLAEYGETPSISDVELPDLDGYVFLGFFKTYSASSDNLVARDGTLNLANLATLSPSGTTPPTATAYSVWQKLRTVNINANATSAIVGDLNVATLQQGDAKIYYGENDNKYYADNAAAEEVGVSGRPLVLPSVRCNRCTGIFGAATNGNQKFDGDGMVASGAVAPTAANSTWYAQWERKCFVVVLDDNGGSGGAEAIFLNGETIETYSDDDLTTEISSVAPPTRTGYTFLGYYTAKTSGNIVIDASGNIVIVTGFGSRDLTIYARWVAKTYQLSFVGGGEIAPIPVTFDSYIGTLPTPSPSAIPAGSRFSSWLIDGLSISATTAWSFDEDKTATAGIEFAFGDVTDYFGLASATLIPFESDDGSNLPHLVTRHYGRAAGAEQGGYSGSQQCAPIWLNPTVKYMVVGDMTLTLKLGKSYPKKEGQIYGPFKDGSSWPFGWHRGMKQTGFMISSVAIDTRIGQFPIVTVSAVANEGKDAINNFTVSVPILARARAQNLIGAISGGGELHAFTLVATCDPVVLQEYMAPCASDVVNGRYEAHAETLSMNFEDAPISSNGFVAEGNPVAKAGTEYTRYRFTARKEIV